MSPAIKALLRLRQQLVIDAAEIETQRQEKETEIEAITLAIELLERDAAVPAAPASQVSGEGEPTIPEGFIPWSGGECPVDPTQLVEILHPDGSRHYGSACNQWWQWTSPYAPRGIIAYRIVADSPGDTGTTEGEAEQGDVRIDRPLIIDPIVEKDEPRNEQSEPYGKDHEADVDDVQAQDGKRETV